MVRNIRTIKPDFLRIKAFKLASFTHQVHQENIIYNSIFKCRYSFESVSTAISMMCMVVLAYANGKHRVDLIDRNDQHSYGLMSCPYFGDKLLMAVNEPVYWRLPSAIILLLLRVKMMDSLWVALGGLMRFTGQVIVMKGDQSFFSPVFPISPII